MVVAVKGGNRLVLQHASEVHAARGRRDQRAIWIERVDTAPGYVAEGSVAFVDVNLPLSRPMLRRNLVMALRMTAPPPAAPRHRSQSFTAGVGFYEQRGGVPSAQVLIRALQAG